MIEVNLYWGSQSGAYRMTAVPRAGETILIGRKVWHIQAVEWVVDVGTALTAVNVRCDPDSSKAQS